MKRLTNETRGTLTKRLTNWALALLMFVFLVVAAFGEAGGVEVAMQTTGNLWLTLAPKEKTILVVGVIDGMIVASYAEAARLGPGSGSEVFTRMAITRELAQIVLRLDAFFSEPENRECNVGIALVINECAGAEQIIRDIQNLDEEDW